MSETLTMVPVAKILDTAVTEGAQRSDCPV